MAIEKHELKISTSGSAGSASGSGVLALPLCELVAVHLDYHASAPATTDVTITASGNPAARTIFTRSNSATDGWFRPREQKHDTNASAITGDYAEPVIHANILVDVAQADALTDAVVLTFYVRV